MEKKKQETRAIKQNQNRTKKISNQIQRRQLKEDNSKKRSQKKESQLCAAVANAKGRGSKEDKTRGCLEFHGCEEIRDWVVELWGCFVCRELGGVGGEDVRLAIGFTEVEHVACFKVFVSKDGLD